MVRPVQNRPERQRLPRRLHRNVLHLLHRRVLWVRVRVSDGLFRVRVRVPDGLLRVRVGVPQQLLGYLQGRVSGLRVGLSQQL